MVASIASTNERAWGVGAGRVRITVLTSVLPKTLVVIRSSFAVSKEAGIALAGVRPWRIVALPVGTAREPAVLTKTLVIICANSPIHVEPSITRTRVGARSVSAVAIDKITGVGPQNALVDV